MILKKPRMTPGLRYVTDERPGISRERKGDGWIYRKPDGSRITSQQTIDRINAIVIPPAWTDVWICTDPRGHIQATGRDDRGRKQYRYHPRWRATRDETKFDRMVEFGEVLPRIREQVERDLAKKGLPREKVLATVVRLLETSLIRIGTEEYVKENKSYGLTTFRNRHAEVNGSTIHFAFRGKSGIKHAIDVRDRKLANIVKRMRDLPGYHLFQYIDDDGALQEVDAEDVNDYLRQIAGNGFSAKDFRTWAGTVMCAVMLRDCCGWESRAGSEKACRRGGEAGRVITRQHACGLPEIVYPPRDHRGLLRRSCAHRRLGSNQRSNHCRAWLARSR